MRHALLEVLVNSLGDGSASPLPPSPQRSRAGTASTKPTTLAGATRASRDAPTHASIRQGEEQQAQQQVAAVALGAISNLLMILPSGDGLDLCPPAAGGAPGASRGASLGVKGKGALGAGAGAGAGGPTVSGWHPLTPTIPHYIPEDRHDRTSPQGLMLTGDARPAATAAEEGGGGAGSPTKPSLHTARVSAPELAAGVGDRARASPSGPPSAPSMTFMLDLMDGEALRQSECTHAH